VTAGNPSSPDFTCGGLTFSNFSVTDPTGGAIGVVDINGASYNPSTGVVSLSLNPNLQASEDEQFYYTVTGGVKDLLLAVGGDDATVSEEACMTSIPTSGPGANLCPKSLLGSVSDYSDDPAAPVFSSPFTITSPIYIYKDIETGSGTPPGASQLSDLDQSFLTGAVPEPTTLILFGGGLLAIGLIKRYRTLD
jgi:hypothetical protein